MDPGFVVVQLSDLHIGWQGTPDPVERLELAIESVLALPDRPDAVLVSGDLSETGHPDEYETARRLLARLGSVPYVLPGNHDNRSAIRAAFELPGHEEDPIRYTANLGPLRLLVVDSVRPNSAGGRLSQSELRWLDERLGEHPGKPTVVATHHPPLATMIPGLDAICLQHSERVALGHVLERHPQVMRILAGHVHRAAVADLVGRPVFTAPSTHRQVVLDCSAPEFGWGTDPPGFAVHVFREGELTSHVQPIGVDEYGLPSKEGPG